MEKQSGAPTNGAASSSTNGAPNVIRYDSVVNGAAPAVQPKASESAPASTSTLPSSNAQPSRAAADNSLTSTSTAANDALENVDPSALDGLTNEQRKNRHEERQQRRAKGRADRLAISADKLLRLRESMMRVDEALIEIGAVELSDYVERWKDHYKYDTAGRLIKSLGESLADASTTINAAASDLSGYKDTMKEDEARQQGKIRKLEKGDDVSAGAPAVEVVTGAQPSGSSGLVAAPSTNTSAQSQAQLQTSAAQPQIPPPLRVEVAGEGTQAPAPNAVAGASAATAQPVAASKGFKKRKLRPFELVENKSFISQLHEYLQQVGIVNPPQWESDSWQLEGT